jgi:transcriptional regulator with XRE-family HTH domain
MVSMVDHPWLERHLVITQRLRQRRDELGLTQKQVVSRLLRVGVATTNRALSSLEHGAGLDIAKLPELAQVLDCTVTYLLGMTDDPHSWAPDRPAANDPGTARRLQLPERTASCILGTELPERPRRSYR